MRNPTNVIEKEEESIHPTDTAIDASAELGKLTTEQRAHLEELEAQAIVLVRQVLFSSYADKQDFMRAYTEVEILPDAQRYRAVKEFIRKFDKKITVMQPEPRKPEKKARTRERKSYLPPSREGKVSVLTYLEPEVKEALDKKYEGSAFDSFQEFLAEGLRRLSQEQPEELKPSVHLSHVALAQTRELEKTIARLTQDLSTRSR